MSSFVAAGLFGASFAFIAGGWVFDFATRMGPVDWPIAGTIMPWQMTLLLIGSVGLLVATLQATCPEPRRTGLLSGGEPCGLSIRDSLAFLWRRRWLTLRHNLGFGCSGIYTFALFLWAPTFLSRTYGWSITEAGAGFGLAMLLSGIPGIFAAGWLVSRLMQRGRSDAPMLVALAGLIFLIPAGIAAPLMPNGHAAVALMAVSMFFFSFPAAMPQASLQLITPNELRGRTIGLLTIATNATGMSLGPASVAFLNDHIFGDPQAINLSLSIVSGVSVGLAAILLASAMPEYRRLAKQAAQGCYD